MDTYFVLLTASLAAISCSLPGSFLVWRNQAMMGDAISHAVLPGIVAAYMISGSLHSIPAMLGATLFGLLCSFLIEFLSSKFRVPSEASTGLIFTSLFALGVIGIAQFGGMVDLDTDCVLNGDLALVPFQKYLRIFGIALPVSTWIILAICILNILYIRLCIRPLRLMTFDEPFAKSTGMSVKFWHYSLMFIVSLTCVASFEGVGAVLVLSFLVLPPATANLLSRKLYPVLFISAFLGVLMALMGYGMASLLDASIAGSMSFCGGLLFISIFGLKHLFRKKVFQIQ